VLIETTGRKLFLADPKTRSVQLLPVAVEPRWNPCGILSIVLLTPMINFLVVLNNVFFGSFGLAIIAFTIIIRLVTFPLTMRQLHQTRAMQSIQPRVQEINKKYSDPKRRQEEMMRVYRESGVNPLGCLGPMLLQFPILIALFGAVQLTLPKSPEALEHLSQYLYSWSYIQHAVPIKEYFLGMDLREGNLLMVVLVGLTTYDRRRRCHRHHRRTSAAQQMMAYMMPSVRVLALNSLAEALPGGELDRGHRSTSSPMASTLKIEPPQGARHRRTGGSSGAGPAPARTEPARELRTAMTGQRGKTVKTPLTALARRQPRRSGVVASTKGAGRPVPRRQGSHRPCRRVAQPAAPRRPRRT
jgi:YidC/Oxa1 family membrane protein insertase